MSVWPRVSKRKPCEICERPDWCTVTPDGTAACCMRVESSKLLSNGGWLHRLNNGVYQDREYTTRLTVPTQSIPRNFGQLAEQYEQRASDSRIETFAGELGVSAKSLRRLHIGWDGDAWTFPMQNATGDVVGIRRRFSNGQKLSVRGGKEGLFIPDDLSCDEQIFVCEGPTDTAAILTLGYHAVGRPSCRGGTAFVVQLVRGREIVIVSDQDTPGQCGAETLAKKLQPLCPSVQIIIPPIGIKDVRAWLQAGATRSDIDKTIKNGPMVRFPTNSQRAIGVFSYEQL